MSRFESLSAPVPRTLFQTLRDGGLRQSRLLLALSGGADSTALLRAAVECAVPLELKLHAAHLDHGLRGAAAREDAHWLTALCHACHVPLDLEQIDVPAHAVAAGLGIEEAARGVRYDFLDRTAVARDCPVLLVAHTADDLSETVLHNLLRGTGLSGLKGIPRERRLSRGTLLMRPLLKVTRREIEEYLDDLGQDYRDDSTNTDLELTRNRLRHQLLPSLRENYNPQVDRALRQLAAQAESAQEAVQFAARELAQRTQATPPGTDWGVAWWDLQRHPRHLLREMFVVIWSERRWPRQGMTFVHWERLVELLMAGGREHFPGQIEAAREGRLLVLRQLAPRAP